MQKKIEKILHVSSNFRQCKKKNCFLLYHHSKESGNSKRKQFFFAILGRACIEVLHVFVSYLTFFASFYRMHVRVHMHETLAAVGNFYKNLPCNRENQKAAIIIHVVKILPGACNLFHGLFQISHRIKKLSS